jgi:hypothetical protein
MRPFSLGQTGVKSRGPRSGAAGGGGLDGGWPSENNAMAERVGLIQVEFSSRSRVTDRVPDGRQPLMTRS